MRFYVMQLEVGVPNETWCSYLEPQIEGKAPTCPRCRVFIGSIPTLPPYGIELNVHGKAPGDLAYCPGDSLVVSDRFHRGWEANELRGLDFSVVQRIRVRPARLGKKPLRYFHTTPQFFGTRIDLAHSRFEHDQEITCSHCQYGGLIRSIRGMRIDEASWTGEDLFFAWGLCGTVIVSDRVRELRDKHGLTNMSLTPVEAFFWDPYNQWTPIDYSRDDIATTDDDSTDASQSN